jgi:hypothetical protein
MSFLQYAIMFLVAYLCIYALIDRVCRCVENCISAKALAKSLDKLDDLKELKRKGADLRELSENHTN